MEATVKSQVELAEEVGFTAAAKRMESEYSVAKRVIRACTDYKCVTKEEVDAFNDKLKLSTMKDTSYSATWKELTMTAIEDYSEMPPRDVLIALRHAKATGIFDRFEIATITNREHVRDPDPILFGRIEGTGDRFFIAEWGDDVKLSDIVSA